MIIGIPILVIWTIYDTFKNPNHSILGQLEETNRLKRLEIQLNQYNNEQNEILEGFKDKLSCINKKFKKELDEKLEKIDKELDQKLSKLRKEKKDTPFE